jgi:hypothetical protein
VAETLGPNSCVHTNQKYSGGVWVCKLCGSNVVSEPLDPEDFGSIKFGGGYAFKVFRDYGKTEREMTKDNIERFVKEKGYDPVPESGGRWI